MAGQKESVWTEEKDEANTEDGEKRTNEKRLEVVEEKDDDSYIISFSLHFGESGEKWDTK